MKTLTSPDFINGEVLLIDKPIGWTSFDAVKKVRNCISRKLQHRRIKVGHAGTLDPLAEGLLILCTGAATRRIQEFMGFEKEYKGIMHLGAITASYDRETPPSHPADITHLTPQLLLDTAKTFLGEIDQIPPLYSAVNIDGKRAYTYAREKKKAELPVRKVTILQFELSSFTLPEIAFHVKCSKGTYIRSLVHDFGQRLQCGAYLKSLTRTMIGPYSINDAIPVNGFDEWLDSVV